MSVFVQQEGTLCSFDTSDNWVILSPIEQSIKKKIELRGTPLKKWNIQINYGIKTGCNEAFIISSEKRDQILDNCKTLAERERTAELIRPILRGRDIKQYGFEWADLWLINTHNGVRPNIPRIDINEYPAIKAHLDDFFEKLAKRADKGETPYNLRNCAYLEDFSKPKIVYNDITQRLSFALSVKGEFMNNTVYYISSDNLKLLDYLLKILNSKLIDWYYRTISVQLGEKAVRMFSIYVLQIPVPLDINADIDNDTSIYELYGLTDAEGRFIDSFYTE